MNMPRLLSIALLTLAGAVTVAATLPSFGSQDPEHAEPQTAQHKWLLEGAGEWKGTMSWTNPDGSKQTVAATESNTTIGKFWLNTEFRCDMMGQPYLGVGHSGYDPKKKKFTGSWVDSMTSFRAQMEGDFDEATQTLRMHWTGPDMMGKMVPQRYEAVRSDNSYVSTFYTGSGDTEYESMVIKMQRVGAAATDAAADKGEAKK